MTFIFRIARFLSRRNRTKIPLPLCRNSEFLQEIFIFDALAYLIFAFAAILEPSVAQRYLTRGGVRP